jgi:hypothetical protein
MVLSRLCLQRSRRAEEKMVVVVIVAVVSPPPTVDSGRRSNSRPQLMISKVAVSDLDAPSI